MSLLPNTVINGNCLEVMKEIDDASIDMILCDLPYGATQNSWDSVIPPAPLWEQYERIIKPNGAILLFGQDKFTATMMLSNPKLHRYNIIWDKVLKSGFLNAKKMPLREHEDMLLFRPTLGLAITFRKCAVFRRRWRHWPLIRLLIKKSCSSS